MAATWAQADIRPLVLQWNRVCQYCGVRLLTGERSGFCCGEKGKYKDAVAPLPPLPPELEAIAAHPRGSSMSRKLNVMFSFAALESTHTFPTFDGHAFVAVKGHIYHRVRPQHHDTAVKWLLYDGHMENVPHAHYLAQIPHEWVTSVRDLLYRVNPFARALRAVGQLGNDQLANAYITLRDAGATEIAAIINFQNTLLSDLTPRQLVISPIHGVNYYVPTISRMWEPLAYPILFPHGSLGWGVNNAGGEDFGHGDADHGADSDQISTQMWHHRLRLLHEPRFEQFGRLTNEFLVDMFSRNIESRLYYIGMNLQRQQQEDAHLMGQAYVPNSENVYLPASFIGSRRWAQDQVADCLGIAAKYGGPTFFVTMTCNPNWPEIEVLRGAKDYSDMPLVIVRAFRQRLAKLENTLKYMFPQAGPMVSRQSHLLSSPLTPTP